MFLYARAKSSLHRLLGYLLAGCLTIFGFAAGAAGLIEKPVSFCGPLLETVPYDPTVLSTKGIDLKTLSFKMKIEDENTYEIIALIEGKQAGTITVFRDPDLTAPAFRSTMLFVNDKFLGKGMGTMLYVIAAKFVRDREGARLRSDFEPGDDAIAVWKRFVSRGFAEEVKVFAANNVFVENYFYLKPDRVDQLAKEIYPLYLERLQKP